MTAVTRSKKQKKAGLLKEVQSELKKVKWTSKEELKGFTKIVIGSTLFFGIGIYFIDSSIQGVLHTISELVKRMIG